MNTEEMAALIKVALGAEKADLVIANGSLVNVYTGELLNECSVAVKGERIAYIGKDIQQVIDADTIKLKNFNVPLPAWERPFPILTLP